MLPPTLHCVCSNHPPGILPTQGVARTWLRRAIARSAAVMTVVAVVACASGEQAAISPGPMALVDAYLIAHGMAASYANSGTADPAVVNQLARLDRKAAEAVQSLSQVPNSDQSATAAAISALAGYAARQSIIIQ